jgi:type VI secretion system protein ImpK
VTPASAAVPPAAAPPPQQFAAPAAAILGSGLNPLVDSAAALLALVGQLRNTPTHPDVAGLREHVVQQIKVFEQNARTNGVTPEATLAARYTLCTLLDETVLSTPWGSESVWSSQSLLSTFHNETWGGEKFFMILDRMIQQPAVNIDMLELMFICLSLGFEGKYGVLEQGRAKLTEVQDNLFRSIRMQRGDFERDLSPHWLGVQDSRNVLVRYVPLWVVGALAGVLLLVTYAGLDTIGQVSKPEQQQ